MRISAITKIPGALLRINYLKLSKELLFFMRFFVLVVLYLWFDLCKIIARIWPLRIVLAPLRRPVKGIQDRLFWVFNTRDEGEISSLDLILLAVRHLKAKKTRTIITIGGMSIGFGSVLFLLSLGYGTQRLVVSRVARLDEMQQITVTAGQASSLKMNNETIASFSELESVESVLPMISVVSKVNFNNSVSDVVVYGVSRAFLEESAIKPVQGELFEDGVAAAAAKPVPNEVGQVAGVQIERRSDAKMYKELSQVRYSLYPLVWKAVYSEPSQDADVIGYTTRVAGTQDATEVWGQVYVGAQDVPQGVDLYGNEFSAWISDSFSLWEQVECVEDAIDCVDGTYQVARVGGVQRQLQGYITESEVTLERYTIVPESGPSFIEGEVVDSVQFAIPKNAYSQVYSDAQSGAEKLNLFTAQQKSGELYSGELVFGGSYSNSNGWGAVAENLHGANIGLWIRAKVPLWRKLDCTDCEQLFLTERDSHDEQVETLAIIRADSVRIEGMPAAPQFGQVLGEATESASLTTTAASLGSDETASTSSEIEEEATEIDLGNGMKLAARPNDAGEIDWVTIASGSAESVSEERTVVEFAADAKRQAIANQAMLSVLGIPESEAIGKTFTAVLVLDQEFFDAEDYQAESTSTEFTIKGVIPGDKNPAYYIPFSDIQGLGVQNYSQIKVVVDDQGALPAVRQSIESMGYKTTSVVDTVGKINDLFATVRLLLSLLGMVALSVAALGMFNTLTVSLLEKTREVGLMKAIGMKSNEVKRLFLAESIVMGLSGGIFGIILSGLAGNGLSLALSMFSVTKGLGFINLVYTPLYLSAAIIAVAFLVGVLTGLYPSHRATKISALNALRYE